MFGGRLRSFGVAALLAFVLVLACRQITSSGWNAQNPAYRAQVDALLDGRLALSHVPDGLIHDLVWTPDGVQQVWGLGVPAWQLPFEALGRLVGWSPFPDRVALIAWLALSLCVVLRAFRPRDVGEPRPDDRRSDGALTRAVDSRATQIGALLVTALLPGLLSVLRGRIGVYEEAAIYAYGAAMILLGGLVGLRRTPTAARYLVLVAFAGLTGLFRPTVWFYGLATAAVASVLMVRMHGRAALRAIALGTALFVAGGAVLYATNAVRFGRGREFGHSLNVHSLAGNIVATRFSYPFERVGVATAAEELLGSLFDRPELRSRRSGNMFYQTALHRGQAPVARWREYYFTTFSWLYLPAILAGVVLAARAWRRDGDAFARMLSAWAVLGGMPLVVFYLRSPSVSSRYQLDLAPAVVALLVVVWRAVAARWPRRGLAVLIVLWGAAVATSKITRPKGYSEPVDSATAARGAYAISRAQGQLRVLPHAYDAADPAVRRVLDVREPAAGTAATASVADAATKPAAGNPVTKPITPETAIQSELPDAEHANAAPAPASTSGATAPPPTPGSAASQPSVKPLYQNGYGWDLATGKVRPAALFYVQDAAYIALDVTGPAGTDWSHAVRVAVGLDHLRLASVVPTADGARLRFEGGSHHGLELAFIAFGPDDALDQPFSRFGLRSIRWRD